ncbi:MULTISPECIES: hypothetical protein [Stutzerimonas stutzeri subgroup]|uniref:Uncharacterized protein n=1 Tax=Stutzerimonas stutzeri TaxID=316 RepID=A0A2N8RKC8_STUST|nr:MULTISPECIES: hypothetical protein [Stutzerimonas stutzeri subgroup]KRW67880.1 hypothetical protein AO741_06910 [Pseudomonas sp. TTU2014-105ASC]MDH2241295.1 hypothetical protein [Pseudomonas sp. GD03909]MDH2246190.1 hypothetical protein [Pseudomonas sp. GD03856]MDH2265017.1 hypothetical protein [Pseudomonas sp. GD03855]MBA1239418.1 hypothetical protein [Stutzerimonas kunmingensis]
MSRPLSTSNELSMRKDLVRLRMEMHRQQMLYHAQPLSHPLQHVRSLMSSHRPSSEPSSGKGPMMIATTVLLALFGRRMGKIGKLARIALTLYPLIKGQQRLRGK